MIERCNYLMILPFVFKSIVENQAVKNVIIFPNIIPYKTKSFIYLYEVTILLNIMMQMIKVIHIYMVCFKARQHFQNSVSFFLVWSTSYCELNFRLFGKI